MKNIIKTHTCQTEITRIKDITYTPKRQAILSVILKYALRYPVLIFKQMHIAKQAGTSLRLVNTMVKELEGILFKHEHRFKNNAELPSRYYLNPLFREKSVLRQLVDICAFIKRIPSIFMDIISPLFLLSGNPGVAFLDQYFQNFAYGTRRYIFKKPRLSVRKTYNVEDRSSRKPTSMSIGEIMNALLGNVVENEQDLTETQKREQQRQRDYEKVDYADKVQRWNSYLATRSPDQSDYYQDQLDERVHRSIFGFA
jgi:hypothetical protein